MIFQLEAPTLNPKLFNWAKGDWIPWRASYITPTRVREANLPFLTTRYPSRAGFRLEALFFRVKGILLGTPVVPFFPCI